MRSPELRGRTPAGVLVDSSSSEILNVESGKQGSPPLIGVADNAFGLGADLRSG
ncbi:hypothetical protein PQQ99_23240 [Paraburkholderia sediminicola]|uniref:Uncharacterized protein n=1 Tax=Paraburkholderia metrosideri TaxID=580937 RepID=A0ABW9DMU7_9BURK